MRINQLDMYRSTNPGLVFPDLVWYCLYIVFGYCLVNVWFGIVFILGLVFVVHR